MAQKPLLLVVAGAIFDSSNKVLLAKRPKGATMEGFWEFPGGKIEPLETPEEALKREIFEETDLMLDISNLKPLSFTSYEYERFHLLMPLFACCQWSGTLKAKENQEFIFTKTDKLHNFKMPPADYPLIAPIINFTDSLKVKTI